VPLPPPPKKRSRPVLSDQPFWRLLVSVLLIGGFAGFALFLFSPFWNRIGRVLPVSILSPRTADYSADGRQLAMLPVRFRLVVDALADHASEGGLAPQIDTLMDQMRSPVPTITAFPGQTQVQPEGFPTRSASFTPAPTIPLITETAVRTPTETLAPPTKTLTATSSMTATWQVVTLFPVTTRAGSTATPVLPSEPPTQTPEPTETVQASPTAAATLALTATLTQLPPTSTPASTPTIAIAYPPPDPNPYP
jgi:hypothetical protein